MTKRRRFSADFKARVALEALRGDKTIQEIAVKHKVHPNQVSTWKRQAMWGGPGLLDRLAAKLRCLPVSDHAAKFLFITSCCCC